MLVFLVLLMCDIERWLRLMYGNVAYMDIWMEVKYWTIKCFIYSYMMGRYGDFQVRGGAKILLKQILQEKSQSYISIDDLLIFIIA